MADRDTILANFQACTDINDIEECIAILEQSNWNLMEAVQTAIAGRESPVPTVPSMSGFDMSPPAYSQAATGICDLGLSPDAANPHSVADSFASSAILPGSSLNSAIVDSVVHDMSSHPIASSSNVSKPTPTRRLQFTIEHRDRTQPIFISDSDTVGQLKELIEREMDIPVSAQVLRGWINSKNDLNIQDGMVLRELQLPRENTLFLLTSDNITPAGAAAVQPNNGESANVLERLSQTFTLSICYKDGNANKHYNLNFPGSKTVQEVKGDVYTLIDVPVRHQVWSGWPDAAADEAMTLAGCEIGWPCHELVVSRVNQGGEPSTLRPQRQKPKEVRPPVSEGDSEDGMEVDGSDEDFEDAHDTFNDDDDIFEVGSVRRPEPLMPENARDQTEALERFTAEFSQRYGECHPVFYIGSLENALQEALLCRAKDRKLLAIYLHHDSSIMANVFCSQVLCAEGIVNYLSNNFVTWAWDLTSEANKARLLNMCSKHFGSVAANTVRNFKPDELPLLLLISRSRSINEVVNVIRANITVDELMTHLIQAIEVFREQQHAEISEEMERDAREQMKRDQEQAYEESLAADRAKAETKRLEEEEKRRVERQEEVKRQEEERARKEEEQEKEAIRLSIEEQLPNEPPEGCNDPVTKIRIRTPSGEVLSRRFLAKNALQVLLNYITSCGYHVTDYKVLTTFPRRDLTQMDSSLTLEVLKMCPQDTVILEAKDSE